MKAILLYYRQAKTSLRLLYILKTQILVVIALVDYPSSPVVSHKSQCCPSQSPTDYPKVT